MQSTITHKGRFVFLLSGLAAGDETFLNEYGADNPSPYLMGIQGLNKALMTLSDTRVARYSRKGWLTIDHPDLGMVQWKQGWDFRTAKPFLFVRINGRQVLNWWPTTPHKEVWASCPASVPDYLRSGVVSLLKHSVAE